MSDKRSFFFIIGANKKSELLKLISPVKHYYNHAVAELQTFHGDNKHIAQP